MAMVPNGVEKLPKISTGRVGCTNVTDDRWTGDSSSRSLKNKQRFHAVSQLIHTFSQPTQDIQPTNPENNLSY